MELSTRWDEARRGGSTPRSSLRTRTGLDRRIVEGGTTATVTVSDTGTWSQNGNQITFNISNGTTVTGVFSSNRITFVDDGHEIHVFGAGGQLERVVRWNAPLEPISEEERAQYEEWRVYMIEEDPAGSLMPTRADHPSELRPAYYDLLVDDDGNMWVQDYPDPFLADVS